MTKVILAGSYEEYVHCLHMNNLNERYVPFITQPNQIEELRESVEPIYFGSFYKNPRLDEIEKAMKAKGIRARGEYVKL